MEIKKYIFVAWKWWWLVSIGAITVIMSTILFTNSQKPTYESNIQLIVSPSKMVTSDLRELRSAIDDLNAPVIANTFAEISQSSNIIKSAWSRIKYQPQEEYLVSSSVIQETIIVEVKISGPDPVIVQALANAIIEETDIFIEGMTTIYELSVLDTAEISDKPVSPNVLLNIVSGIVVGLGFGIFLAFFAEYLQSPINEHSKP